MNATTHPVHHGHHHGHHLGHGWAPTAVIGTIAATAVGLLLTATITAQDDATDHGAGGSTSVVQGSTRDRADVPGPCFARPARWNDAVSGPVPRCGG
jgi:hypothetical protein